MWIDKWHWLCASCQFLWASRTTKKRIWICSLWFDCGNAVTHSVRTIWPMILIFLFPHSYINSTALRTQSVCTSRIFRTLSLFFCLCMDVCVCVWACWSVWYCDFVIVFYSIRQFHGHPKSLCGAHAQIHKTLYIERTFQPKNYFEGSKSMKSVWAGERKRKDHGQMERRRKTKYLFSISFYHGLIYIANTYAVWLALNLYNNMQ